MTQSIKSDDGFLYVPTHIWEDPAFRRLSTAPSARLLWIYLISTRRAVGIDRIYAICESAIAADLGWEQKEIERTLAELEQREMVKSSQGVILFEMPPYAYAVAGPDSKGGN